MSSNLIDNTAVCFKHLKCYVVIENGNKIEIVDFLDISEQLVNIIDAFGKMFLPIVVDMRGNIEKIRKSYRKNVKSFIYVDQLLVKDLNPDIINTADAFLWLNRALHLICQFFDNMLTDETLSESLKHHLQDAYEKTLKPHHNWLVQNTVSFIYRWVPKRTDLLGKGNFYDDNIASLAIFLPKMQLTLSKIDELLKNLNNDECVIKN